MKKFDVSEVVIRQESAVVVSFQPMIEVNLVEVRGYHLFAQFVALRAQERNLQTGEDSDQRLCQAIRAAATVGLGRLYLAWSCGDH